ncbi:MAG: helix-turn-helix transcriptional regulator [Clostridiales bacterium]|nr:helix-turn-helix transcriptional regulator [Clostridiales bacterium]
MTQKKEITPTAAFYRRILAVNVRFTRKKQELTQEQLAEQCGISPNQVSNIERKRVNVGLDILAALADGFGITASELLDPKWPKEAALRFSAEEKKK